MTKAHQMDLKHGRSAMWGIEADLLSEICRTPGDHVEVGTLWGASAIIAAQAKPPPGRIFSIDIMRGGYWAGGDPGCDLQSPTARDVLENFAHAGVAERITLICARSHPWPLSLSVLPSTALIDAGHNAGDVRRDWQSVAPITSKFIALHDYGEQHPDVGKVIEAEILTDPNWRKYRQEHTLLVMQRVRPREKT